MINIDSLIFLMEKEYLEDGVYPLTREEADLIVEALVMYKRELGNTYGLDD